MKKKYIYYLIFGISFLSFQIVQEYIRPNYDGSNAWIIYALGILPNFLPGIGLPSFFYVLIPELFQSSSKFYKHRLSFSILISVLGLVANEFTHLSAGPGVFDWNDILWSFIGAILFYGLHKLLEKI